MDLVKKLKIGLALLLVALVVVFTAQNYAVVEVRFLLWRIELSRAIVIFGSLVAGVVVGWLLCSFVRRST